MNNEVEKKHKILIVDDDVDTRTLISFAISREGYEVVGADNGQHATELFNDCKPDLIILDIMMPVMDGIRFLRWLRIEQKDTTTKVLVLTAVASEHTEQEAKEAGANVIKSKPCQLPELISTVKNLIQQ